VIPGRNRHAHEDVSLAPCIRLAFRRTRFEDDMRFRIRTILILIAVAAPAMGTLAESANAGCLLSVAGLWASFVGAPLLLIIPVTWLLGEGAREKAVAMLEALAIVGYAVAMLASLLAIAISQPWF